MALNKLRERTSAHVTEGKAEWDSFEVNLSSLASLDTDARLSLVIGGAVVIYSGLIICKSPDGNSTVKVC